MTAGAEGAARYSEEARGWADRYGLYYYWEVIQPSSNTVHIYLPNPLLLGSI